VVILPLWMHCLPRMIGGLLVGFLIAKILESHLAEGRLRERGPGGDGASGMSSKREAGMSRAVT
jgi:hypothetical protein